MKSVKKSEITKKSPRQTPGSRNRQRNQKSGRNHEEIRNHRQKTSDFEISYTILPRVGPLGLVQNLLKKINSLTESDEINVNSVFLKYSSLTHKGKTFSSSFRQLKGPCIVQAHWNEDFYGSPPTSLPEPLQPTSNVRPVRVRFYCKIHYTIESKLSSVLLAAKATPPTILHWKTS